MQKIQNSEQIHNILNKIMGKLSCHIKVDDQDLPAGFVAYNRLDDGLELRLITELKDHPPKRYVVMYHQGKAITVVCRFHARRGKVELLVPLWIEIAKSTKVEAKQGPAFSLGIITNITSFTEICGVLERHRKMLKTVVYKFEDHIKTLFKHFRVYLNYGDSVDLRLKALIQHKRIIFFNKDPDLQTENPIFFPISVYMTEIQKRDLKLSRNFVSEITVPIMYKAKIVFGLIQINADHPLTMSNVGIVKKIAADLEKQIRALPIPFEDQTKIKIIKLDFDGLTMEFRDRKLLRHCQIGNPIFFKLHTGVEEIGQFSAIVKNRNNYAGKSTVDCQFEEKDALSEINLESFLEKLNQK
jgi:hypothetical protein